ETTAARVAIDLDEGRLGALGVATTPVAREALTGELRAVATVVPDESQVSHVHTRVSGWVERLSVTTTGESVRSGQVLGAIFSRELLASQTEYVAALRAGPTSPLVRGGRDRLRVLGMTDAEIEALGRRGEPLRNVPIVSPRAGVVLHRGVTRGAAVDPSTELFIIADLSRVWVLAEVPESRMAEVAVGTSATLELASSGIAALPASVDFVYPTLTEGTRTLRVRFVVANPEGAVRPGAFGTALFHLEPRTALVVPRDAVVDHGASQYVFVAVGGGRFEPRPVELGGRFEDTIEILAGVTEGELVVSSGVFLLDSESRLRASGGAMAGHGGHGGSSTGAPPEGSASPVTAPPGPTAPRGPSPGGEHAGHGGGAAP
ncbi:MAG: efflux RND transporter periplasmic adaptor subunit, partial [Deltaproteobacteria bacterium]|nr:efflux RND transporter periplasmic adaptor subunit [Deltaproteobacteria bacterium]